MAWNADKADSPREFFRTVADEDRLSDSDKAKLYKHRMDHSGGIINAKWERSEDMPKRGMKKKQRSVRHQRHWRNSVEENALLYSAATRAFANQFGFKLPKE